jgi:hypothetical protein
VGLEDNLSLSRGEVAPSNADQVRKIRRILAKLSLAVTIADDAQYGSKIRITPRSESRAANGLPQKRPRP